MARIKIEDLPAKEEMSEQELKGIFGGFNPQPEPPGKSFGFQQVRRGIGRRGNIRGAVIPKLSGVRGEVIPKLSSARGAVIPFT